MVRGLRLLGLAGALVVVVGAACGDDDRSGGGGGKNDPVTSCEREADAFSACGGDVEGTWKIRAFCTVGVDFAEELECAEATGETRWDTYGATFTFADGKAESPASPSKMVTTTRFPLSCVEEDGVESCDELSFPAFGIQCTGGEQCTCVTTYEDEGEAISATYTISGDVLIMEDEGGMIVEYEYCVQGNTLFLSYEEDEGVWTLIAADRT